MSAVQEFNFEIPAFAQDPSIRAFLAAWNRWRGQAVAPKRSDIRLGDIPGLMRGVMLMDAFAPEKMVFRYAGSQYQDMYKFDFTGLNYMDITPQENRALRAKRLWGVVAQPAAAVWTTPPVGNVDFIGASVPILPDEEGHPRKIMQLTVLSKEVHEAKVAAREYERETVYLSDNFRYIDIGAGKPDTGVEA